MYTEEVSKECKPEFNNETLNDVSVCERICIVMNIDLTMRWKKSIMTIVIKEHYRL